MESVTAVILAGGKGRRLQGCDKGLLPFKQRPIIETILQVLSQHFSDILINANRNQEQYARYSYPVVRDDLDNFQGPLSGIATALSTVTTTHILTVPCDSPFLSQTYMTRMLHNVDEKTGLRVAYDGKRLQNIHALIPVNLYQSLQNFLASGQRKVTDWYQAHDPVSVDFSDCPKIFYNINNEKQLNRYTKDTRR